MGFALPEFVPIDRQMRPKGACCSPVRRHAAKLQRAADAINFFDNWTLLVYEIRKTLPHRRPLRPKHLRSDVG